MYLKLFYNLHKLELVVKITITCNLRTRILIEIDSRRAHLYFVLIIFFYFFVESQLPKKFRLCLVGFP